MPRILLCSPTPLTPRLGASKVYMEVGRGFREQGWDVTLVGPDEVGGKAWQSPWAQAECLRQFLIKNAAVHDVVEYEHDALPFNRSDFAATPLMVARSVLLNHNVVRARIPPPPTWRARLGAWLKRRQRAEHWRDVLSRSNATLTGADLINVSNRHDREALLGAGYADRKIVVHPFGLFAERYQAFDPVAATLPAVQRIAFVGTFDPRKGMGEFSTIASAALEALPKVRFRLVGTSGMVTSAEGVLAYFKPAARHAIEVIPRFEPADLPRLLSDCSVGIFPSHCEGFGFGVLEMLAAGLPVFAYDAPGPPEMLPPEYLAPVADGRAMVERVLRLLADRQRLIEARSWARARAADFDWNRIIIATARDYETVLARRRSSAASG